MALVHAVLNGFSSGNIMMDPENIEDNHGGGCRTAFLSLVKELPKYGHKVRAFSTFTKMANVGGIDYHPIDELTWYGNPQVMWACYDTRPLSQFSGCLRIGSHHTLKIEAVWPQIDIHTGPTKWALDRMKAWYSPHGDWRILPNAIGPVPEWNPVPGRVIYHTSADRGLHKLLEAWPAIKAVVPHATLHIISKWEQWTKDILAWRGIENSETAKRARQLLDNFERAKSVGGVVSMFNLPRHQLERELSEASVFAFPCTLLAPCETFSASIMECCKIGVPVVLAPADALESIYSGSVVLCQPPVEEHLNEFINRVLAILQDQDMALHYSALGKKLAETFTYERSGKILSDMMP